MKAMILAAGLGTRLRPLTDNTPKALIRFRGKTLLEHAVTHLRLNGVTSLIINVHHLANQVIEYIEEQDRFGMHIEISDEREQLLDTGGGLKKAGWFFADGHPFFLYNVDIISDMNLKSLMDFHIKGNALATLAVRNRVTSRYFLFDKENLLGGWTNVKTGEKIISRSSPDLKPLAFSGIQVMDPHIFSMMPDEEAFPIVSLYLKLSGDNKILGFQDEGSFWKDAGRSPEELIAE